jgi:tetratricopeptide (TPR) repeat protein
MILRTHGAPGARQVCALTALLLLVTFAVVGVGGCGQKEASKDAGKQGGKEAVKGAASDTVAFKNARAVADTTARLAAWESFLAQYPTSPFRTRATASYCGLLLVKDPGRLNDFVTKSLATEKDPATRGQLHYAAYMHAQAHASDRVAAVVQAMRDDPLIETDACNMVAWDLVERNQLLDEAIALAAIGVQKAPDDESKASILDTEGWAQYVKGNYPAAIERLVQATELDKQNSELLLHLAQAYDKGGNAKEALSTYVNLLIPAEDPEIRARVQALSKTAGEPPAAIFRQIDSAREANAKPASAFSLKDYAGRDVNFADTKGKVVLLNFWHPT